MSLSATIKGVGHTMDRDDVFANARSLEECETVKECFASLEKFAKAMGFDQLLYTCLPSFYDPAQGNNPPILHTNYDSDWMGYYLDHRYDLRDAALNHCLSGVEGAYMWPRSHNIKQLPYSERKVFLEAGEAGLKHGFTLPMRNTFDGVGVMSFTFDGTEKEFELFYHETAELAQLFCYHFNETILNKAALYFGLPHHPKLTAKELEVLKWLASGITYEQVADKLRVGVSTIRKHNTNILKKFKARNTTHACAMAIRWGVLA